MSQQTINVGTSPNDGTGTPLRTAFQYTNSNFSELYTAVGPSGNNIVVPGSATITGNLTVDTNTLFVDSTNNRVGINNATPSYALDVLGSTTISGRVKTSGAINAFYLEDSGTTPGSLYIGTSGDTFRIITGSNVRVNVDSSGNLGLGVTPSAWGSPFKGFDISSGGGIGGSSTSIRLFSNAFYNGSNYIYKNSAASARYDVIDNTHVWYYAAGGTAGNAITFTQAMTLDASGNLLVGTTTSSRKLTVSGGISYTGAIGEGADTTLSSSGTTLIHGLSSTWTAQSFYSSGTNRMTVKANGQIRFEPLASDPAGAAAGDVYYNSVSNRLKYYNGTAWTLI